MLLLRQDRPQNAFPWALDLHFIAVLFSILHRRDLLQAIRAKISAPGFARHARDLHKINPADFELVATLIGEAGSLRHALRLLAFVFAVNPGLLSQSRKFF
jgi:hypothetical protein